MENLQYTINDVIKILNTNKIIWREHVLERMLERNIKRADIKHCLSNGEIIEEYPKDYPFPSCLVFGTTIKNKPLHVVCSIENDYLFIITTYYPNLIKWENDYKTRKEQL